MLVIQGFLNGDKLTEFIKLSSYVLGMIARYSPSKWLSLLRNDNGDFAQPLLVGATEELEMNFAKEFLKQLHSVLRKIPNDVK